MSRDVNHIVAQNIVTWYVVVSVIRSLLIYLRGSEGDPPSSYDVTINNKLTKALTKPHINQYQNIPQTHVWCDEALMLILPDSLMGSIAYHFTPGSFVEYRVSCRDINYRFANDVTKMRMDIYSDSIFISSIFLHNLTVKTVLWHMHKIITAWWLSMRLFVW